MNILPLTTSRLVSVNIRSNGRLPISKRTDISKWIAECNRSNSPGCYIFRYPGLKLHGHYPMHSLTGLTHLVFFDEQDAAVFKLKFDL